jgi:hypothetical protein
MGTKFLLEILKERDNSEYVGIDEKIILERDIARVGGLEDRDRLLPLGNRNMGHFN